MLKSQLQEFLSQVNNPSRYLGTEINAISKKNEAIALNFGLCFPDLYEIGSSHFGIQILYSLLNRNPKIWAERIFAPDGDLANRLQSSKKPLFSLESHRPLKNFHIIGFSLLSELNYTNILHILDLGHIPFLSSQRDLDFPLIIAGGPCTCNPEPFAKFFDAIVVGEAEQVIIDLVNRWFQWKNNPSGHKTDLLKSWAQVSGLYIPSFFEEKQDPAGHIYVVPKDPSFHGVQRSIVSDLNQVELVDDPILPYNRPVHDRLRVEIARGCTRGCRFCQAGMIYRPVRERNVELLMDMVKSGISKTGYEEISLLSLSSGDYCGINTLLQQLMDQFSADHVAISLPSLRADSLTSSIMNYIKRVRKTGFTIAPEAASERCRHAINKNITNDDIFNAVQAAFELEWKLIKLYFLIGLPGEQDEDINAFKDFMSPIISFCEKSSGYKRINLSINTFIPKAHTPFQWEAQNSLEEINQKIHQLKSLLKHSRINLKWQNPESSFIENILSRGDRSVSDLLIAAYKNNCRFDGWTNHFNFNNWENACHDIGFDPYAFANNPYTQKSALPWQHIKTGVSIKFLKDELNKAKAYVSTADCRQGKCQKCGVCDFETIKPSLNENQKSIVQSKPEQISLKTTLDIQEKLFLKINFSKTGPAKFFGHLELVNIFRRAFKRIMLPVIYSQGFHPLPKLKFSEALPLGLESRAESLIIMLYAPVNPVETLILLNKNLPEGLCVYGFKFTDSFKLFPETDRKSYIVKIENNVFDSKLLNTFLTTSDFFISKFSRKRNKHINFDIKPFVEKIRILNAHTLYILIKDKDGIQIRPKDILSHIFALEEELIRQAQIIKHTRDTLPEDFE